MKWMERFQLFLFDFDGVLVDTEPLHYEAYRRACLKQGIEWGFSFERYCKEAHGEAQGIKKALVGLFPEIGWESIAAEKKRAYVELIGTQSLGLMPGVQAVLEALQGRQSCVVTNSSREHVEAIKKFLPILQTIPHWLTRDDYQLPKPSPEGYLKAIERYALGGNSIGFEDSFKGFKALCQTSAVPVLICPPHRDHVAACCAMGGHHFASFEADISLP
jgi:beta-phosphoglucomutase